MRWSVLLLVLTGCNLFGTDDESCTPLPPTTPEDLWSIPWVELNVPQGFCNVAAAYQFQIYTFGSHPVLVDDVDGFGGEMTFPPGSQVTTLSGGGAEVILGAASGEVCGRHHNDCTPPGELACQPLTVVAHDVFTATRNDLLLYQGGALAYANGAVWDLQPRYHDGVWRMDPETLVWEQVLDTFPEGTPGGGDFSSGDAIVVGTDIWYVANGRAFRFDTAARTWTGGTPLADAWSQNASSVVHNGRLYIQNAEIPTSGTGVGLFTFDPVTVTSAIVSIVPQAGATLLNRQNTVAFARGDKLVFGGGNECDERNIGCWKQDFRIFDPATGAYAVAPFRMPGFRSIRGAIDFDDRTILFGQDSTAWLLRDDAADFVALPRNPVLASCTPRVPPPGALHQSTVVYGDRAVIVGGEGADNFVTLYLR